MPSNALLRTYPNGLRARITPRGDAFLLELYDQQGRRKPDLPVIVPSLEEAQQIADGYAEVQASEPWIPVYRDTFRVALPDDSADERHRRARKSHEDQDL